MEINLELYTPHSAQRAFHESKSRFRVVSFGRQAGKSTMGKNELALHACNNPNTNYWFLSPIYSQARDQYRKMLGFLPHQVIKKKSDTELRVDFINGSSIEYKSGEVLDRLRGATLHGVVLDEVRDLHPDLWPLVIRPMLATTQGWAAFISTPNGFDAFYDLYEKARLDSEWAVFQAPSTCNPAFSEKEFESARRQMSADEFAQEIMAEFRDFHRGKAYINFSQDNIADSFIINHDGGISPHIPILVAMDFNIDPMAWVLGQNRGDNFYFFDELVLKNSNTQEAAKELIAKVRNHPSGVLLIGDATGKARQRAAAGASDYSIIEEFLSYHGVRYENRTPTENPQVKDRINTVNAKLKDALGNIHLWVHPRCVNLIRDFQRVSWKEGATVTLDKTTDKSLTHASDAAGYAVCALSSMWNASPGGLRVIIR